MWAPAGVFVSLFVGGPLLPGRVIACLFFAALGVCVVAGIRVASGYSRHRGIARVLLAIWDLLIPGYVGLLFALSFLKG